MRYTPILLSLSIVLLSGCLSQNFDERAAYDGYPEYYIGHVLEKGAGAPQPSLLQVVDVLGSSKSRDQVWLSDFSQSGEIGLDNFYVVAVKCNEQDTCLVVDSFQVYEIASDRFKAIGEQLRLRGVKFASPKEINEIWWVPASCAQDSTVGRCQTQIDSITAASEH